MSKEVWCWLRQNWWDRFIGIVLILGSCVSVYASEEKEEGINLFNDVTDVCAVITAIILIVTIGQVLYLVEILEAVGFNQQQGRLVCLYRVSSSFEVRA